MKFAWFFLAGVHQHAQRLGRRDDAVPRRLARRSSGGPLLQTELVADPGSSPRLWALMFVFVWIRGSVLRFRYDQFMAPGGRCSSRPRSVVGSCASRSCRASASSRASTCGRCCSSSRGSSCSACPARVVRDPRAQEARRTAEAVRPAAVRPLRGRLPRPAAARPGAAACPSPRKQHGLRRRARPTKSPGHAECTRWLTSASPPARRASPARSRPPPDPPRRSPRRRRARPHGRAAPARRRAGSRRPETRGYTSAHQAPHGPRIEGAGTRRRVRRHAVEHVPARRSGAVPVGEGPRQAAVPRPPPKNKPVRRRSREVHRLRAVRVGVPADAIYVEGADNTPDAQFSPGAVRPRLPDQLPALHLLRAVHRGVPDARAHDDQRVRGSPGRRAPG